MYLAQSLAHARRDSADLGFDSSEDMRTPLAPDWNKKRTYFRTKCNAKLGWISRYRPAAASTSRLIFLARLHLWTSVGPS